MFQIELSGMVLKIVKGGLRKGKSCLARHSGKRHRELGRDLSAAGLESLLRSLKGRPGGVDSLLIQRSSDGYAEFI